MLERVRILCEGHAVTIETMDVDKDPELDAEYGKDVPVLFADGTEICRHRRVACRERLGGTLKYYYREAA